MEVVYYGLAKEGAEGGEGGQNGGCLLRFGKGGGGGRWGRAKWKLSTTVWQRRGQRRELGQGPWIRAGAVVSNNLLENMDAKFGWVGRLY